MCIYETVKVYDDNCYYIGYTGNVIFMIMKLPLSKKSWKRFLRGKKLIKNLQVRGLKDTKGNTQKLDID